MCITRSKVLMLSLLSILALNGSRGEAAVRLLSESSCPRLGQSQGTLRLFLRATQSPSEKSQGLFPRRREIVLELATSDPSQEPVEIWTTEDNLERSIPPLPMLVGSVVCSDYGGDRDLDGMVLILKSDWKLERQEGWFFLIQLPTGRNQAEVKWQAHVPRFPMPRGVIAEAVDLHFVWKTTLIATLRTRNYGKAPPVIFISPSRKNMAFYSSEFARQLELPVGSGEAEQGASSSSRFFDEWRDCLSLEECTVATDRCGNLTGVRRDSRSLFLKWPRGEETDCEPRRDLPPSCQPSLSCVDGSCSVRWEEEGSGEDCSQ